VKSLLHLFLWGELLGIARLFNRDGIFLSHSIGVKSLLLLFLWGEAHLTGIISINHYPFAFYLLPFSFILLPSFFPLFTIQGLTPYF
jgi:hypothetical protein